MNSLSTWKSRLGKHTEHNDWKEKLKTLRDAAKDFIATVGMDYDFDEDEFTTKIPEVQKELSRDTLSSIDELASDLDYYFG